MFQNRKLGAALIAAGVLASNHVYPHDLVFGTYEQELEGAIVLGRAAPPATE